MMELWRTWGTLRMWGHQEGTLGFLSWGSPWDGRREHRRGGFRSELLMGEAFDRCLGCVSVWGVFLTTRGLFFSWCHEKHFGDYLLNKNDSQLLFCVCQFYNSSISS